MRVIGRLDGVFIGRRHAKIPVQGGKKKTHEVVEFDSLYRYAVAPT